MCRTWRGCAPVLALLLFGAIARGQDARELERRLVIYKRSADSTRQLYLEHMKRVGTARAYPDTIAILDGNVTVITTPALLPLAQSAAARADSMVRGTLGASVKFARGTVISVRADTSWKRTLGGEWVAVADYSYATGDALGGQVRAEVATIATSIASKIVRRAVEAASPAFSLWREGPLDIVATAPTDWANLRFELASSSTSIAHDCYGGSMDACALMLGLRQPADSVTAFYDSAGRRALVRSWGRWAGARGDACRAGADSVCIALIRQQGRWLLGTPASARAREIFANLALTVGGPRALERLTMSKAPIGEAFAEAAGVPLDSLLRTWQRNIRDQGIKSESFSPLIGVLSIGWIIALGLLSLRSSRWR